MNKKLHYFNKLYFLLSVILVLIVPASVVSYFANHSFLLVIMTIFLGFFIGIFYKIIIFNIIPKDTFMDVGYIKFLKPMYDKFVARSINLLSDDNIKEIDKNLDYLLEFTLIKDLIENKFGNPDKETIKNIKDIIIKLIPNAQLIGIDIKKGIGEPLTERLARGILKDKKKEFIISKLNRIDALLYAISCTNQSKPSIREVKIELNELRKNL